MGGTNNEGNEGGEKQNEIILKATQFTTRCTSRSIHVGQVALRNRQQQKQMAVAKQLQSLQQNQSKLVMLAHCLVKQQFGAKLV